MGSRVTFYNKPKHTDTNQFLNLAQHNQMASPCAEIFHDGNFAH